VPTDYRWSPITDLPADLGSLTDGELGPLIEVWVEQRSDLSASAEVEEFTKRLGREWAIETGIIEGAYTLDRGVTQALIEGGIDAALISHDATDHDPEELGAVLQDHLDALEGLFAFVKGERELTVSCIKELHSALMRHQKMVRVQDQFGQFFNMELQKGAYKTLPNNPKRNGSLHEYCPPEHVASEMDRMVALHKGHEQRGVPAEVEAAWLHHAFSQIHPFQDGNGRVARAIASLVFIKAGSFPLVITRDDRADYIEALETADQGDLAPLVARFVRAQRRALLRGVQALIGLGTADVAGRTVDEEIAAARKALVSKGQVIPGHWERANEMAPRLSELALKRLEEVSQQLQSGIGKAGFSFELVGVAPEHFAPIAKQFGYEINPQHSPFGLVLKTAFLEKRILFSLHAVGLRYRGIMAGLLFLEGTKPDDMFQVNYKDDPVDAERRFKAWFEKALADALRRWRQSL
jgi:Fic family protein